VEQDRGSDTVDANVHLGFAVDGREYTEAAAVLKALGVKSVHLMTNNPRKVSGLATSGIEIESVRGVPVAAHLRNMRYLETKRDRLGHSTPLGDELTEATAMPVDVTQLLGELRPPTTRPYVVLKYAQSIDGRIATASGDSKWISGPAERVISHALRARCDAIMVGVGTVVKDNPQLTVRMVPGASPVRVVLDSTLRIPLDARVLDDDATTIVLTTTKSSASKLHELRDRNIGVRVVPAGPAGVDLAPALRLVRDMGVQSLVVEGGARVITSLLAASLVDRLVVGVAPMVMGRGLEGVGDLGVFHVRQGVALTNRSVHLVGDDVVIAWDVGRDAPHPAPVATT
jgi:3,4-dihydroxy 2-butanone 4-phosphate synthase/GTP cyclohydrolase II